MRIQKPTIHFMILYFETKNDGKMIGVTEMGV